MKNQITWLACWLACGHLASAQEQVTVEVLIDRDWYLADEALEVRVRVTNHSGQTLHLGKEADWLTFAVGSYDNKIVSRYGDVPMASQFVLENEDRGTTFRVNLAPYFGLDQPGRYRVVASVNFRELGLVAKSLPAQFDIRKGVTSWSHTFGVPKSAGDPDGPPEVRKYLLQSASTSFYLRLTDQTGAKVFKVLPLDGAVAYSKPQTQVDKASNLHLLYRSGSQSFSYWVIDPDGTLLLRQTHVYHADRWPKLKKDEQGGIVVKDGARKPSATDLPAPGGPGLPPAAKSSAP